MKSFNLNDPVYVKLNQQGYAHWQKKYNESLPSDMQKDFFYFKDKTEENGYVRFLAWNFMNIFGDVTGMGYDLLFETTILLNEKDLK